MTTSFKTGWVKDTLDERDYKYSLRVPQKETALSVDLRPKCPKVINQGTLGSCTACATTSMVQFVRGVSKYSEWMPSPLFTYYSTRLIEGSINRDDGASLRNTLISTVRYGVTPELFWRYNIKNFTVKPPQGVWNEALKHQTIQYLRIDNTKESEICDCLTKGYPFVFGVAVYESFLSSTVIRTGIVPFPNTRKEKFLGGHALLAVGYEGTGESKKLIVQNSWGTGWGQRGFCKIPFKYITSSQLCGDCWTIRTTEN